MIVADRADPRARLLTAMVLATLALSYGLRNGRAAYRALVFERPLFAVEGSLSLARLAGRLRLGDRASERTRRLVGFALSQLALLAAAAALWRLLGGDRSALFVVAGVWTIAGTVAENLAFGLVTPLLLALLVTAWRAGLPARRDRLVGGGAIGLAIAIAAWPAGLLAVPLLARRLQVVAAGVAVAVPLAVALGSDPAGGSSPWTFAVEGSSASSAAPGNHSLVGRLGGTGGGAVAIGSALFLTGSALVGWASRRRKARNRDELAGERYWLATSAVVSLGLLALPVSPYPLQLLQLPGVALLALRWLRRGRRAAPLLLSLALLGLTWGPLVVGGRLAGSIAASPLLDALATGLVPLLGLTLFALYLAELRRGTDSFDPRGGWRRADGAGAEVGR